MANQMNARFVIETAMHVNRKGLLASMMRDADQTSKDITRAKPGRVRGAMQTRLAQLSDAIEYVSDGDIDKLMDYRFVAIHALHHACRLAGVGTDAQATLMHEYYNR